MRSASSQAHESLGYLLALDLDSCFGKGHVERGEKLADRLRTGGEEVQILRLALDVASGDQSRSAGEGKLGCLGQP